MSGRPLRVCLDARLADGVAGGIQQFVMGLASGLSRLGDGDEEYLFLSDPGQRGWLTPHLSGPCRPIDVAAGSASPGASTRWLGAGTRWVKERLVETPLGRVVPVRIPASDGAAERSGADLVHLTLQAGFSTALPTIYQPYDLQHVHLPQFFTPWVRRWRDETYSSLAAAACSVVVMSSWVKEDAVRHLHLAPEKVRVIPWGPITQEYPTPSAEDLSRARQQLRLPDAFALYPAQTFPHKNHLALLEAVDVARRRGFRIHVVCPGKRTEHYPAIARRLGALGLAGNVTFVGYVSPLALACLYRLARFLVFPSLFEGGGMPIFEAFAAGAPVACSNVTGVPRQAGDAALVFDPRNPEAMADAMIRLWSDAALREDLARRGAVRVARFSWDRTARTYRALYRQLAGRPLTDEDRALLAATPDT